MDWGSFIRARFEAAGALPDADVLAELADHAASVFEASLARGAGLEASRAAVERQIEAWALDAGDHRRPVRVAPTPPPAETTAWLAGLGQDVHYGLRQLSVAPGFTAIAIAATALAVAAVTTMFAVVWSVLLAPLPWPEADRLVRVYESRRGGTTRFGSIVTNATYLAWRDHPQTISDLAGWRTDEVTLTGDGPAERVEVGEVTASIASLLRVRPALGRLLLEADEQPGAAPVAVLSYGFWDDRFGGRAEVIGRTLRLDGESHTIVGVLPSGAVFPDRGARVWVPLHMPAVQKTGGGPLSMFNGLARLAPGVTTVQAAAEATARGQAAPDPGPVTLAVFGTRGPVEVTLVSAREAETASVRPALLVLLAAVALLLATATANVAGVQLARALTRRREMAIRGALGADAPRLARQLLVENLVLGAAGGGVGLALAAMLARMLPSLLPATFPRVDQIALDWRAAAVALSATLATSLACGTLPALFVRRVNLVEAITEGGLASSGVSLRLPAARLRMAVIMAQVAMAAVLLVGATLLATSFVTLLGADRGFDPTHTLTATLPMPTVEPGWRSSVLDTAVARLKAVPGVTAAGFTSILPLTGSESIKAFSMPGKRRDAGETWVQTGFRVVSPGYFAAIGMRMVEGRQLTADDTVTSRRVVVVNHAFARTYLGDAPLGSLVPVGSDDEGWTVVGVSVDVRSADAAAPGPEVFVSSLQWPTPSGGDPALVIRTAADPVSFGPVVRSLVRELDPALAVGSVMTMEDRLDLHLVDRRLYAVVLVVFALLALGIAGVGLFGVLSSAVVERSREMAVRAALGAAPRDLVLLVVGQGLAVTMAGLVVGCAAALALARLLTSVLYGIAPDDPRAYAAVGLCLLVAAALASIVPARRAARQDPMTLLRRT